jgi:hypothetical protein
MNRSFKPPGKSFPRSAADKPRGEIAQVLEDRPKEFLGHSGWRTLLACDRLLRLGGVAPRRLDSGIIGATSHAAHTPIFFQ